MSRSGQDAFRGFMYQIQVSIWLTLDFLVHKRLGNSVELEPLQGEDLELLRRDEDTSEKACGFTVALQEPRRYIVQTKSRRAGHWTPSDLLKIIKGKEETNRKGKRNGSGTPTLRRPPIEVLTGDTSAALLFVTNTTVQSELTWFLVSEPDFSARTAAPTLPAKKAWTPALSALDMAVLSRIGVLQQLPFAQLGHDIDAILARDLNVPFSSRGGCQEALQERFRQAMLAEHSHVKRDELLAIAKASGGLPEAPRLFVPPRNWRELQGSFDTKHVIILCGEQGTGKTTIADRLIHEHQTRPEPFQLLPWTSPDQVIPAATITEPTLVYAQDPFGRYGPSERAEEWANGLSTLRKRARNDLRILVTTPEAFAGQHLDDPKLGLAPFRHDVTGGMFEGTALLDAHVKEYSVDPGAKRWLEEHKRSIVLGLDRPFCYHVLLNLVDSVPVGERTNQRMFGLIRHAQGSIDGIELEKVFLRNGEDESVIAGLAAVWITLEAWPQEVVRDRLTLLVDLLATTNPPVDVTGAATLLRKFRMLKPQRTSEVLHPIYEKKCYAIFSNEKRSTATRVAAALAHALLSERRFVDIVPLLRYLKGLGMLPSNVLSRTSNAARTELPQVLRGDDPSASRSVLEALALTGSPEDPVVLLAACLFQIRDDPNYRRSCWFTPAWSPEVRARVIACPDTAAIVCAFLRQRMFTGWIIGAEELVDFLYGLVDVSLEFDALSPAREEFDESFSRELVIRGAAQSRNATIDVLLKQMLTCQRSYEDWERRHSDYDEDVDLQMDQLIETANEYRAEVDAHVDAILKQQDRVGNTSWAASRSEPYVFECYGRHVTRDTNPNTFHQILSACPLDTRARMLLAVQDSDDALDYALRFLHEIPPDHWVELIAPHFQDRRGKLLSSAAKERTRQRFEALFANLPIPVRIDLAYDIHIHGLTAFDDILHVHLTAEEFLVLEVLKKPETPFSERARELLLSLTDSDMTATGAALRALSRAGVNVDPRIAASLESDREDSVHAALEAASLASVDRRVQYAAIALAHERAAVRKHALQLLRDCPGDLAISEIVSLKDDPTGSVKLAVVAALAGRIDPAAWKTLLYLADDTTDMSETAYLGYISAGVYYTDYRVADAAERALHAIQPKSDELIAAMDARFDNWRAYEPRSQ